MHDPGIGRHNLEAAERFLCPAEQCVPLPVALELEIGIHLKRARRPELVHDHRVVDHQFGRQERIDPFGVAAHLHDGVAHRGEIDDRRYAGEIL